MVKKGYNWKSRQVVNAIVDDSSTEKIKLDVTIKGNYDKSNRLVLPSKKRRTKIKHDQAKTVRILSKKHRKKLEKIVEKKTKKENRANLLEALSHVQAAPDELEKLTSIASIQTKGLKRHFQEQLLGEKSKHKWKRAAISTGDSKPNSIKGAKRRKLLENDCCVNQQQINDPNIVGIESDSSENEEDPDIKQEPVEELSPEQNDNANIVEIAKATTNDYKKDNLTRKKDATKEIHPRQVEHKPAVFVDVIRDETIEKARLKLPILAEEQQIMETINENPVVIIAGATGSGKTTQIPQFLYEAGYALNKMIAITEPRRVAAISMSQRVGVELAMPDIVGYLIRFEGNVTDETKIKFMTDGVLLKEIQSDFLLTKYSVIILDEAHERSIYTDILIGFLSRIVPLRQKRGDPLKLLIMSATLRLEDFTRNKRLFRTTPPIINVEIRQFPVTIHFNKRTNDDYLTEAFNKIVKIHNRLPEGGILVFLTGQKEVMSLVRKLHRTFRLNRNRSRFKVNDNRRRVAVVPKFNLDDFSLPGAENSDVDFEEGDDDDDDDDDEDDNSGGRLVGGQPMWVLPLYSLLPTQEQQKVFKPPPEGCRLCVVSTNVAETSLTIPNIKYVVDSGRTKVKLYDKITGVTRHVVSWTSKASADQRAGRAGRQGPGHCYRLYSSAVFNDVFRQFSDAEIQHRPLDDLVLQMKCMNIEKVVNFPFPSAPDRLQLKAAENRLEMLGALCDTKITHLGRAIGKYPVLPRFGKMLALSHQQNLANYAICLVAALSVQEVLMETTPVGGDDDDGNSTTITTTTGELRKKWGTIRRKWAGFGNSLLLGDNMVLLKAVGGAEYANSQNKLHKYCTNYGLRHKAIVEIRKLRLQLTNEIRMNIPEADVCVDPKLPPPTDLEAKLLRQILLTGLGDQVARKIPTEEMPDPGANRAKLKNAYQANNMEQPVYLHSGSVLRGTLPEFVVYNEIYETTNQIYMRGVTAIEPEWLATYVPNLCNLSPPLSDPPPFYRDGKVFCTVAGTFGRQAWPLASVEIEHPRNVDGFRWFARFLLDGVVFGQLRQYSGDLLSQPVVMLKSWSNLHARTTALLKALIRRNCASKDELTAIWQGDDDDDAKFLLDEYLMWIPEAIKTNVTLMWPPLD